MPTLNINGNIRTNTTAGWTADATVYSAKTILVTTDATYTGTDQRKWKLADGVQTWSNLDYMPIGFGTLGQILSTGNTTGGNSIVITDGDEIKSADSQIDLDFGSGAYFGLTTDAQAYLTAYLYLQGNTGAIANSDFALGFGDTAPFATNYFWVSTADATVFHGTKIQLLSPLVEINGNQVATVNDIKGYTLCGGWQTALTLTDAITYYFGGLNSSSLTTTGGFRRMYIPKAGTIKTVYCYFRVGTGGSSESVTINIRLNNTTSTLIEAVNFSADAVANNNALSIAVSEGDYVEIEIVSPTWVTNPINVLGNVIVYIE